MSKVFTNPLTENPELKQLLNEISDIPDVHRFERWREEFLKEFDKYLDPVKTKHADNAYSQFAKGVMSLAKDVRRLEILMERGDMREDKCSVQAHKCLGNFHSKIGKITDLMGKLMPPTQEAEREAGFSKFNLGAILVRDGFVEYDRLEKIQIHLQGLRKDGLDKVADTLVLQAINRYTTTFNQLLDILADLGLYQVMEQCTSFIMGDWVPMSPKKSPTKSPVKVKMPADSSGINVNLLRLPDLDKENVSQETEPESQSPSPSDSDSDEDGEESDSDSGAGGESSSQSSRGRSESPVRRGRSIFAPKPTDPSDRVYRRSKSVVPARDYEHTAMKKSSGNTFEFFITGMDEWKNIKSDKPEEPKKAPTARSKSVGPPVRRQGALLKTPGSEDRTSSTQRQVKPITPEDLKLERLMMKLVRNDNNLEMKELQKPMMRLHGAKEGDGPVATKPSVTKSQSKQGSPKLNEPTMKLHGHSQELDETDLDKPTRQLRKQGSYNADASDLVEPRMKLRPSEVNNGSNIPKPALSTQKASAATSGLTQPTMKLKHLTEGSKDDGLVAPMMKLHSKTSDSSDSNMDAPLLSYKSKAEKDGADCIPNISRTVLPENPDSLPGKLTSTKQRHDGSSLQHPTMKLKRTDDSSSSDKIQPIRHLHPDVRDSNARGLNKSVKSAPRLGERGRDRNPKELTESPRKRGRSLFRKGPSSSPTASPRGRGRSLGRPSLSTRAPDENDGEKQGLLKRLAAPLLGERAKSTGRHLPEGRNPGTNRPQARGSRESNEENSVGQLSRNDKCGHGHAESRRANTPFRKQDGRQGSQSSRRESQQASDPTQVGSLGNRSRSKHDVEQSRRPTNPVCRKEGEGGGKEKSDRQKRAATPFRRQGESGPSEQPTRRPTTSFRKQDEPDARSLKRSNSATSSHASNRSTGSKNKSDGRPQQRSNRSVLASPEDDDSLKSGISSLSSGKAKNPTSGDSDSRSQPRSAKNVDPRTARHFEDSSGRDDTSQKSRRSDGNPGNDNNSKTPGKLNISRRKDDDSQASGNPRRLPGKLDDSRMPKCASPLQNKGENRQPRVDRATNDSGDGLNSFISTKNDASTRDPNSRPLPDNRASASDKAPASPTSSMGRLGRPKGAEGDSNRSYTPFRKRSDNQGSADKQPNTRSNTPFRKGNDDDQPAPGKRPNTRSNTPFRKRGDDQAAPDKRPNTRSNTPFRKGNNDEQTAPDKRSSTRSNTPFRKRDDDEQAAPDNRPSAHSNTPFRKQSDENSSVNGPQEKGSSNDLRKKLNPPRTDYPDAPNEPRGNSAVDPDEGRGPSHAPVTPLNAPHSSSRTPNDSRREPKEELRARQEGAIQTPSSSADTTTDSRNPVSRPQTPSSSNTPKDGKRSPKDELHKSQERQQPSSHSQNETAESSGRDKPPSDGGRPQSASSLPNKQSRPNSSAPTEKREPNTKKASPDDRQNPSSMPASGSNIPKSNLSARGNDKAEPRGKRGDDANRGRPQRKADDSSASSPNSGTPRASLHKQTADSQQPLSKAKSNSNMPDRKEPKGKPDKDGYCPCCGQKWPVWKRWFGWGGP